MTSSDKYGYILSEGETLQMPPGADVLQEVTRDMQPATAEPGSWLRGCAIWLIIPIWILIIGKYGPLLQKIPELSQILEYGLLGVMVVIFIAPVILVTRFAPREMGMGRLNDVAKTLKSGLLIHLEKDERILGFMLAYSSGISWTTAFTHGFLVFTTHRFILLTARGLLVSLTTGSINTDNYNIQVIDPTDSDKFKYLFEARHDRNAPNTAAINVTPVGTVRHRRYRIGPLDGTNYRLLKKILSRLEARGFTPIKRPGRPELFKPVDD